MSSVGGCGYARWAPGTLASAVAAMTGAGLLALGRPALGIAIGVACVAGWWAIRRAGAGDDPGWVVIDEVAGQWIALLTLGRVSWLGVLIAFGLFRLLDIAKPGPVGWADRRRGPLMVMLDDVVAGGIAAVLILAARALA